MSEPIKPSPYDFEYESDYEYALEEYAEDVQRWQDYEDRDYYPYEID